MLCDDEESFSLNKLWVVQGRLLPLVLTDRGVLQQELALRDIDKRT
jgi:hypothetical protein